MLCARGVVQGMPHLGQVRGPLGVGAHLQTTQQQASICWIDILEARTSACNECLHQNLSAGNFSVVSTTSGNIWLDEAFVCKAAGAVHRS